MTKIKVICFLFMIFTASIIKSGQITPALDDYMQGLTSGEKVQALVMFNHQADIQTLNQQLKLDKVTLAERNRRVIEALQEAANLVQPAMVSYLDELKSQGLVENYTMMWITNMFAVTATRAGIEALAERTEIADMYLDYPIELVKPVDIHEAEPPLIASHEVGLERINAIAAWEAGYTGAGRLVMNVDTGVMGIHPALASRFRGDADGDGDYSESWFDPQNGTQFPCDDQSSSGAGHGTHTMGTICGRSESSYDTVGVAIDALWIAAGVIDVGGSTTQNVILTYQWAADPDVNPNTQDNPDACGNSWGYSPFWEGYEHCEETFWAAMDNLEAAGTAIIFSAGNEGNENGSNTPNSLRTPADRETTPNNCFSVGSVNGHSQYLPITGFSSRGPTYCTPDGSEAIKPEVVAPGENIRSSYINGGYINMSGTSMASPHITGSVAVIRQVNPDLDVDSIKAILINTAYGLPPGDPDGEDNSYGNGIIDLYAACLAAQEGYGYVEGYVYNQQSQPLVNAVIRVEGNSRKAFTNSAGFYRLGMPGDLNYTLTANVYAYLPDTITVDITIEDTLSHNFILEASLSGAVHGYVTDEDSNPIPEAELSILNTPISPVVTNTQGYYIFSAVPGGSSYEIEVSASGYGIMRDDFCIAGNDTVSIDFSLLSLESFESDNGGLFGEGDWEWGSPSSGPGSAYHGDNVWATVLDGNYSSDADIGLVTPYYAIDSPNAVMSFYHWYYIQEGDGGNVQVSLNGGWTWETVTPVGGYPYDNISGLDGEPGFSRQSFGWHRVVIDLSVYAGQTIKIRFHFGSDSHINLAGWYIDGFLLTGGEMWNPDIPPSASYYPTSILAEVFRDSIKAMPLIISNAGSGILDFEASVSTSSLMGIIPPDNSVITDTGGPDGFGYIWKDSREPDGPVYNWVDITENGTPIDSIEDNINLGPFDIGFEFPFYGNVFDSFRFCSNGFISFTSIYASSFNKSLPHLSAPYNMLAPFWDNLSFQSGGQAFYYSSSDTFIVSFHDVSLASDLNTSFTFQIILLQEGDIIFQYNSIDGAVNFCTVGIQNHNGNNGTQIAYNEEYIDFNLAVQISPPTTWLSVEPTIGMVLPEESVSIDVLFDALDLEFVQKIGQVIITTNDPDLPSFTVPCTLQVIRLGIDDEYPTAIPVSAFLNQNYPNPFNPITEISFGLPAAGQATLDVYDIMGRKVKTLINDRLEAGIHRVYWNSTNNNGQKVSSGIYFYMLDQGDNVITKKMMLLK